MADTRSAQDDTGVNGARPGRPQKSAVLHRKLDHAFLHVVRAQGQHLILDDGRKIFDAVGGAAVSCLGHGDERVIKKAMEQMKDVAYCATIYYTTKACEELCRVLVDSTNGKMARAYIVNSGKSEAGQESVFLGC